MKTEYYEWCDYWIEDTGNVDKPRVLLIGDSISRGYRPEVIRLYGGRVLTDNMASSRGLDNPDYYMELGRLLDKEGQRYDVIHFNNGLHAFHLTIREYEECLKRAAAFITKRSSARLILALSTPVYHPETGYDNEKNQIIQERNKVMCKCAQQNGLTVNDLYSLTYGRMNIRMADGVHYRKNGSRLLAKQVAACIGL